MAGTSSDPRAGTPPRGSAHRNPRQEPGPSPNTRVCSLEATPVQKLGRRNRGEGHTRGHLPAARKAQNNSKDNVDQLPGAEVLPRD